MMEKYISFKEILVFSYELVVKVYNTFLTILVLETCCVFKSNVFGPPKKSKVILAYVSLLA